MMKIAIATGPWFPVPTLQGGATPRLWQGLAEAFAAEGHHVTILCRAYPGQPEREIINGVHYKRQGGFPQSANIWWDLIKDLIYALLIFPTLPEADILVINDFWLPVFAPLRRKVGKVVVSVGRFPKGQFGLYGKVDLIAVLTKAIYKGIAQQTPSAIPRMRIIPNPVDTRLFHPPEQPRSHNENTERVFLYVGRIHPEKGLDLLIDAFILLSQNVSSIRLRIVGPMLESQGGGGEKYFNSLKAKAEGYAIEFLAPIFDPQELSDVYREADYFCYPSLAEKGEAFPVAPLEAMATGLIPIVSNIDCFKEYIEAGETGFYFNHKSENAFQDLSNTMRLVLEDWKNSQQVSSKTSQAALAYSYSQIAGIYLQEFRNLAWSATESPSRLGTANHY